MPEEVARLVGPMARDHGLELLEVEFRPQGRRSVLRLYVDRPGGVSLDALSRLSREVGDLLDVHNAVPGGYTLECSSPGVNRRLKTPEDFARYVGRAVRVRTQTPIEGTRSFSGRLAASSSEAIEIEDAARGRVVVPIRDVERAHYEHDFSGDFRSPRS